MKNVITKFIYFALMSFIGSSALAFNQYTTRIISFNTSDHLGGSSLTYFVVENNGTRATPQNCLILIGL